MRTRVVIIGGIVATLGAIAVANVTAGSDETALDEPAATVAAAQDQIECPTSIRQNATFDWDGYTPGASQVSDLAGRGATLLARLGAANDAIDMISEDLALIRVSDAEDHLIGVLVAERDHGWRITSEISCGDIW